MVCFNYSGIDVYFFPPCGEDGRNMMLCTSRDREHAGISGIPASSVSQAAEGYVILLIRVGVLSQTLQVERKFIPYSLYNRVGDDVLLREVNKAMDHAAAAGDAGHFREFVRARDARIR